MYIKISHHVISQTFLRNRKFLSSSLSHFVQFLCLTTHLCSFCLNTTFHKSLSLQEMDSTMYIKFSNTLPHVQLRLAREETKQTNNQTNTKFNQGTRRLKPKTSNNQRSDTMLEHYFFQKLKLVENKFNNVYQTFQQKHHPNKNSLL